MTYQLDTSLGSDKHPVARTDSAGSRYESAEAPVDGGCLIVRRPDGWFIQADRRIQTFDANVSVSDLVRAVQDLNESARSQSNRCVLAFHSSDCFFVCGDVPDGIDVNDRTAIRYELERYFPVDAESMTSDYTVGSSRSHFSAVAVESNRYATLVEELEANGLDLVAIVPTSFLVARGVSRLRSSERPFDLWMLAEDCFETMRVGPDGVLQWKQFSDVGGLRLEQRLSATNETGLFDRIVVGQDESSTEWNAFDSAENSQSCPKTFDQLRSDGSSLILAGRWGNWINLRQGDLAPSDPLFAVAGALRWLALAAAICFATIAMAASFRGKSIARQSTEIKQQQTSAFKQAFPNERTPVFLMREVRRRHSRVIGTRGGGDEVQVPIAASLVIRNLYLGLIAAEQESQTRFRMMMLNIDDGTCSIDVHVKDTSDLGVIAKSLEAVGFQVEPPASQQITTDEKEITTYESRIVATWGGSEPPNSDNSSPLERSR